MIYSQMLNHPIFELCLENLHRDIIQKRDGLESLREKFLNDFGNVPEDSEEFIDLDDSAMEDMLIYDSLIDGIENILKYIESSEENLNNAFEDLKKYIEKKHIDLH